MKLSDDKKAGLFKKLASTSLYEVGVEYGLDKHYKDASGVKNKVYQIYREVAANPERFAVQQETVDLVQAAVSSRKIANKPAPTLREKTEEAAIVANDIKGLTLSGRDAAGRLIARKLEHLESHPKALAQESLVNLGKIFGILFDKAQIIQGQATEHVAHMGKIDTNMTPEDALAAVLRGREITQAEKHG